MRTEGDDPSTVGVEIKTHKLEDAFEYKLYDMAGQVCIVGASPPLLPGET